MTLDEFIDMNLKSGQRPIYGRSNRLLKVPGFKHAYIRAAIRYNPDRKQLPCLDLAALSATKPGNGALKRLLWKLKTVYPYLPIYAENVFAPQLQSFFLKIGFKEHPESTLSSYFMVSEGSETQLTRSFWIEQAGQIDLLEPKNGG